jgi:hypothetical protein
MGNIYQSIIQPELDKAQALLFKKKVNYSCAKSLVELATKAVRYRRTSRALRKMSKLKFKKPRKTPRRRRRRRSMTFKFPLSERVAPGASFGTLHWCCLTIIQLFVKP